MKKQAPSSMKRILVIDDDRDTCDLLSTALELSGYEVVCAQTIFDGMRLARAEDFSLYLLDNWLPDGSGVEACRLLRATDRLVPVLFCSGAAYATDHQEAVDAGAQAYLDKPVDIDRLIETVGRFIDGEVMSDER